MNRTLPGRALFLGCLAAAGGLSALSAQGTFDRTLSVSGTVSLDVKSDYGGIIITAGSSETVRVRAVIKPLLGKLDLILAEANIRALEKNPPVEQAGDRIRVGYPKDPSLLQMVSIRFEIETPRATEVQARTVSGGIRIEGIAGPVETVTGSGRTIFNEIGGRVSVKSQSGAVQLAGIGGDATVQNSSGGITALGLGGSVRAETKSGGITISQLKPASIRALSGSGSIKVTLAKGGSYQIDALSHSGKISGEPSIMTRRPKDGHSLKAELGTGGPLVDLDTRSSSISIKQAM